MLFHVRAQRIERRVNHRVIGKIVCAAPPEAREIGCAEAIGRKDAVQICAFDKAVC